MARLFLVRHAKAGERRTWTGPDIERPLSKKGWKQAQLLADRLARSDPSALVSSPFVRCVQTLEPLGDRTGLEITTDARLAEHAGIDPVLDLLAELPAASVLCSHGDIIPEAIGTLRANGTELRTPADWRKASVWVLKRNKASEILHATVWPPPVV